MAINTATFFLAVKLESGRSNAQAWLGR